MNEHFSAEHGSTIKREQTYYTQGSASVVRFAPIDGWCFAADNNDASSASIVLNIEHPQPSIELSTPVGKPITAACFSPGWGVRENGFIALGLAPNEDQTGSAIRIIDPTRPAEQTDDPIELYYNYKPVASTIQALGVDQDGYIMPVTRENIFAFTEESTIEKFTIPPPYNTMPIITTTFTDPMVTVAFANGHVCRFQIDCYDMKLDLIDMQKIEGFQPAIVSYAPQSDRLLVAGRSAMNPGVVQYRAPGGKPVIESFSTPIVAAQLHDASGKIVVAAPNEVYTLKYNTDRQQLSHIADEYRAGSTVRSIHINREGSRLAVGMDGKVEIIDM